MPNLQQQIAEKFLKAIEGKENMDSAKIEQLRSLLERGKRPKPDELVQIFSAPPGGEVK